jgi:hypothetical protein
MLIRKKINLKTYFVLSTIHIGLTYFLVQNFQEYLVIISVFIATVLNQWMLVGSVEDMVRGAAGDESKNSGNSILIFLGKTVLLLVVLSFGVHIMGKRIIIPLLNYIVQIFILYFSFRQKDN